MAFFKVSVLFLLVILGPSKQLFADEKEKMEKPQRKGIPIEIIQLKKQTIRAIVYGQGTARSIRREFLSFEAEGKITFIKKDKNGRDLAAGDLVKKDELLASVDKRSSVAEIGISKASVEQAKQKKSTAQADLNKAKAGVGKARADLNKAKAAQQVALAELKRTKQLVSKQVLPRQELDKADADAKQAEAAVSSAMAGLNSANAGVASATAGVRSASSGIDSAKAQQVKPTLGLEDTAIVAPMDGIVSFVNIKEGQYFSKQQVNSNSEDSALKTTPIVIIDPTEFEIVLDLPTFQGRTVMPGQKAFTFTGELMGNAELEGITNKEAATKAIRGEVFSVSPAINPGGRSIQVKVRTKPKKGKIYDGMFVNCWLVVKESTDAIVIPYNTVSYEGKKAFVFVVNSESSIAERREIKLGIRGLKGMEVIQGLNEGDQLVGKGHNRLTNGTPVEVVAQRGDK